MPRLTASNSDQWNGSHGKDDTKVNGQKTPPRPAGWTKSTNSGTGTQERSCTISSQIQTSTLHLIASPTVNFKMESVATATSCLVIGLGINVCVSLWKSVRGPLTYHFLRTSLQWTQGCMVVCSFQSYSVLTRPRSRLPLVSMNITRSICRLGTFTTTFTGHIRMHWFWSGSYQFLKVTTTLPLISNAHTKLQAPERKQTVMSFGISGDVCSTGASRKSSGNSSSISQNQILLSVLITTFVMWFTGSDHTLQIIQNRYSSQELQMAGVQRM